MSLIEFLLTKNSTAATPGANNQLFGLGQGRALGLNREVASPAFIESNSSYSAFSTMGLYGGLGGIRTSGNLFLTATSFVALPPSSTGSPCQVGTDSWSILSSGQSHGAAIRSDGLLFTWGRNTWGMLGDGTNITRNSPVQIGSNSWTAVSGGMYMTSAIRSDGLLFTWGRNVEGQLGDGTLISRNSPVQIGSSSWTAVSAGGSHTAAIRSDGMLFTWGVNSYGQLGDGTTISKSSPVQIGSSSWTAVFALASSQNIAAIRSGGTLFTWGRNNTGQLGDGTTTNRSSPVQIGSSSWIAIGGNSYAPLAIRSDNLLFGWGRNHTASIGDGTFIDRSSPVQIGSSSWTAVNKASSYRRGNGAIDINNKLATWGTGSILGQQVSPPRTISSNTWSEVSINFSNNYVTPVLDSCLAIRTNGLLFAWGQGSAGQIGDGTTITRSSPVQIGSSSWTAVASGLQFSLAIRSDGLLFAWGINASGELGDGTTIGKSSPVQIGSSSWTAIAGGRSFSAAIRSDGLLFTWGAGTYGVLGDGTTIGKSSPVQIGSSSWTAVSCGTYRRFISAIRSDGMLFSWGQGTSGVLGDGTTISKSSPVQIGSSSWTAVSCGGYFGAAIRSGGTLFQWGGSTSSPVQLGGAAASSSWTAVSVGRNTSGFGTVIRTDGALFAWGTIPGGFVFTFPAIISNKKFSRVQAGRDAILAIANT